MRKEQARVRVPPDGVLDAEAVAMAYAKASRALRQTIMLQDRLMHNIDAWAEDMLDDEDVNGDVLTRPLCEHIGLDPDWRGASPPSPGRARSWTAARPAPRSWRPWNHRGLSRMREKCRGATEGASRRRRPRTNRPSCSPAPA